MTTHILNSVRVKLAFAAMMAFTVVACSNQSQQSRSLDAVSDPSTATSQVETVQARYRGANEFLFSADQYKVFFCKDAACETHIPADELNLEAKSAHYETAVQQTDKQMKAHFYRTGLFEAVNLGTKKLDLETAIEIVENVEENLLGERVLFEEETQKLVNYLSKYESDLILDLAEFGFMSGNGDGYQATLRIFNAKHGYISYVVIGTYSE